MRRLLDKISNKKVIIALWIIDIIWAFIAYLTIMIFPEGNLLLKDLTMAVGYSIFRIVLFVCSIIYIVLSLREKNISKGKKIRNAVLPLICYMVDAAVLSVIYIIIN